MAFELVGADPEQPGPGSVVARFMLASLAGDQDAALAMMTVDSREGMKLDAPPVESGRVVVGEPFEEDGVLVVPTESEGDGLPPGMDFVLTEEEGELRIDMDATMTRMMGGISPDQMMEGMGEALADAMGGVMEGMGNAMGEAMGAAFGAVGEATAPDEPDKPEEAGTGRIWSLAEGRLTPDTIHSLAFVLVDHLPDDFRPPMMELESTESGDETTKFRSTRFGTEEQGFEHVATEYRGEGMTSDSVTMTAYGLKEGLELSLASSENVLQDGQKVTNATIRVAGPPSLLDSMGVVIAANFEVLSVDAY